MKIMCQAFQAVTVELTGILLIVWLLFGCASWGIRTTTSDWGHEVTPVLHSATSQLTELLPEPAVHRTLGLLKRT